MLWGDTKNNLYSRADNQAFGGSHTYTKAGIYQVALQATDSQGRVAFLTVATIVNGQPDTVTTTTETASTTPLYLALWPLYTAAVAMVISFGLAKNVSGMTSLPMANY